MFDPHSCSDRSPSKHTNLPYPEGYENNVVVPENKFVDAKTKQHNKQKQREVNQTFTEEGEEQEISELLRLDYSFFFS